MSPAPIVNDLLQQLISSDQQTREAAMQQVGLLLEKHSALANSPDFYKAMLHPDLILITLREEEEQDIVQTLGALVSAKRLTPNVMLWALGTQVADLALRHLLSFMIEQGHELNEETQYEALQAIERLLVLENGKLSTKVAGLTSQKGLVPLLSTLTQVNSPRIKKLANTILKKLNYSNS